MKRLVIGAALTTFVASGCGGHAGSHGEVDGGMVNCGMDPRVDTYTANMSKSSFDGTAKVILISSEPAPPAKGNNAWQIRVTNAMGDPTVAATLKVTPFMPDHGHGTSVKPVITAAEDGIYDINPLNLFMAGVWRVTIVPEGAAQDSVDFFFCING